MGFPIRRSPGQRLLATLPRLFAGCYVLLRYVMSRHPPCALGVLSRPKLIYWSCFFTLKNRFSKSSLPLGRDIYPRKEPISIPNLLFKKQKTVCRRLMVLFLKERIFPSNNVYFSYCDGKKSHVTVFYRVLLFYTSVHSVKRLWRTQKTAYYYTY